MNCFLLCPREEEEEAGSRAVPASVNAGGRGGCALGVTAAWCGPQCEGGGGGAWSTLASAVHCCYSVAVCLFCIVVHK